MKVRQLRCRISATCSTVSTSITVWTTDVSH